MDIAFISYPVRDLKKAVEFYQKLLEIKPLFLREDWAEFELDGQRFALQKVNELNPQKAGATLYFKAEPLEKHIARLERIGAKLIGAPEFYSYGTLVRFHDYDGNIFGLYEPPVK